MKKVAKAMQGIKEQLSGLPAELTFKDEFKKCFAWTSGIAKS